MFQKCQFMQSLIHQKIVDTVVKIIPVVVFRSCIFPFLALAKELNCQLYCIYTELALVTVSEKEPIIWRFQQLNIADTLKMSVTMTSCSTAIDRFRTVSSLEVLLRDLSQTLTWFSLTSQYLTLASYFQTVIKSSPGSISI